MEVQVIYDDSELQVIHRRGDPESTLLAFSAILHRPDETEYWASSPANKYNINCISFSPKCKNYFPLESIRNAKPFIDACLVGKIIGYGASMGGYAALKYSSLFKSDVTIAFSPQVSVSPEDVPFDEVRHCYYDGKKNHGMLIGSSDLYGEVCIMFDPKHDIDSKHVELLRKSVGSFPFLAMPVAYAGHDLINLIADAGLFGEFYERCLFGKLAPLKVLMKRATRASDTYRINLARYCIRRGKRKVGSELLRSICGTSSMKCLIASVQAIEYFNTARTSDAKFHADMFLSLLEYCDDYGAASTVGWVYGELREYSSAYLCYKKATEIEPKVITHHYGLIDSLAAMGFFKQASEAACSALILFEHPELYGKLGWAALSAGDHLLALDSFKRGLVLDPSLAHLREGLEACSSV